MTYVFTDRASYFTAVTTWKTDYGDIVTNIRKTKRDFRDAQFAFSRVGDQSYYDIAPDAKGKYWAAHKIMEDFRYTHNRLKAEVNEMVSIRHGMKKEAQEQYLKRH